jgi:formylglycine-generating enzyme required for sulfatase activity
VKSERCVWEVDKSLALSKRLLPIIFKSVADPDIPEQLRRLQFVRFDTGPGMTRPLSQLAQALRQDLDWIREHTRLGELAARWQARGRPGSLLLRGDDVDAAKAWAAKRQAEAPAITDLQRAFLNASKETEDSEKERGRRLRRQALRMRAVVGALLVGIVAGLGYAAWSNQAYLRLRIGALAEALWPTVLSPAAERALKPGQSFKECAACPEMVVVPAGEFLMGLPAAEGGGDNERPQHKVTIANPFAVAWFEVTFDEWDACVALGGCPYWPGDQGWGRSTRPVINVSWHDAQQYVAWLSRRTGKTYRLLSEAEWEYSARAGTITAFSWGNEIGKGNANCYDCGGQWDNNGTAPVGSFAPNAFGLHDMHGNVFEWVEDVAHINYNGAPSDGSAWLQGGVADSRVRRGGNYNSAPVAIRSAVRGAFTPSFRGSGYGFRVGRSLTP